LNQWKQEIILNPKLRRKSRSQSRGDNLKSNERGDNIEPMEAGDNLKPKIEEIILNPR